MASSQKFFSFILITTFIHVASSSSSSNLRTCRAACRATGALTVRFPFRFDIQASRCGYPGFELACNRSQTYITLPSSSGIFTVRHIDYISQTMTINDPDSCLPRRFLESFSLRGSPFDSYPVSYYTFFNCSSDQEIPAVDELMVIKCLSGENFTVVAVRRSYRYSYNPVRSTCSAISTVRIPVVVTRWSGLEDDLTLHWSVPDCSSCEKRGGFCGFKNYQNNFSRDIGCSKPPPGLTRSAKYGIIIGLAIPALLCLIGFIFYLCGKVKFYYYYHHHHHYSHSTTHFSTSSTTPESAVVTTGLDGPTIESYPKTELGESGRLPMSNHTTCHICLSEYQPKETLRTIPECNHYFHVDCIDGWLRLNATCPLCRNLIPDPAFTTPSTSTSALASLASPSSSSS